MKRKLKYKLPKIRNHGKPHVPKMERKSNPMSTESSRMDDFKKLMHIHYDPKDLNDAINNSDSIGPALKKAY